jgi:hypothetical protein
MRRLFFAVDYNPVVLWGATESCVGSERFYAVRAGAR